jgi:dihydroxyacetone kinase-like protein
MERVRSRLLDGREEAGDIGDLLRAVAMTLISSIGGAAGPLYGAFFMHASREFAGCYELNVEQLAQLFRAGYEGVRQRGKASTGEKTMLDTLHPAVVAFEEAAARGESLTDGLGQAVLAAYDGMVQTREIEAKKGRASYLGLRSIGHQDPGATSAFYLVAALHQVKCPGEEPLAGRIAASEKE